MTFTERVCVELIELPIKKNCCRRALSAGLLLPAMRQPGGRIVLPCRREAMAEFAKGVFEKTYSKTAEMNVIGYHGHRQWQLVLPSPAASKLTAQLREEGADIDELLRLTECESCRAAFLRGLFFVSGTVNDPQKSYHLEFVLPSEESADAVTNYLSSIGYPPRRIARNTGVGLYYKDATSVADLITLMGSHSIIFEFYNARIASDIRNNENRATNCVARNIQKSVAAAARQIEAIDRLMASGKLDSLPEPLRETALLRYRNPDATLDELKDLHHPPISKSGLSHRLQKLLDESEE